MKTENIKIKDVIENHSLSVIDYDLYTDEIAKLKKIKKRNKNGKLIIVTAMNPNKAGEGKTTTTIGLVDGLNAIGVKTIGVLREPSLGPVFGMKGTGSGSNKAKLLPFDKINLHFTGDLHAISSANNLISAIIENEIYQNSDLNIDPKKILWKRCLDMNDRSLREIEYDIDCKDQNKKVKSGFNITAASDLMALFCLANSKKDFLEKLDNTIVAYSKKGKPIRIKDLEIIDAINAIISDALWPNLVRTNENNPFLVHGGPFANIAHGCSSIIAANMAKQLADVVVTECGFGSDLGLEKFMDIVCQEANWSPDLVTLVISLKSIKVHAKMDLVGLEKIKSGFENVLHHLEHIKNYGVQAIVIINKRNEDTKEELNYLQELLKDCNVEYAISDAWAKGSKGMIDAANKVQALLKKSKLNHYEPLYKLSDPVIKKIDVICKKAYGSLGAKFSKKAENIIKDLSRQDYYVCIAKNPYSLTVDPKVLGRPTNFYTTIEDIEINEAANLLIPITSVVYKMPGLPKNPAAKKFIMK